MKQTMEDEKLKDKITEDDKKKILEKCNETLAWLDSNQAAEKEEFDDRQKEVEKICSPIITKLYQSAGGGMPGGPGGMPGGMPGGFPGGAGGGAPGGGTGGGGGGPTIEEVD